jgi:peroxiredoxin
VVNRTLACVEATMQKQIQACLMLAGLLATAVNAEPIAPFRLPDVNERPVDVAPQDDVQATVVCFLGTECPLAKLYASRLSRMAGELGSQQVRFIGVNSNRQDSLSEIRDYVDRHKLSFPLLKDYQNKIADFFDAKRTPEVFVLDKTFVVRYRGRIDDQYQPGISQANATKHDLRTAIDELLAGKAVSQPVTKPEGCLIGRVRAANPDAAAGTEVTYCQQVARVLQANCVECHRAGEIGPFVLDDYDEVAGWADMILEVIGDGRMPPWHASPQHGEFANARRMSEEDKTVIRQWVEAGTPYGDAADLPRKQQFTQGWRLPRKPDLVVEMGANKFEVPAEGTVEYQYFVVDPQLTEDKWVAAAEVVPGNRSVVHHSIVFVRPPDGVDFHGLGWIAAYVPGQEASVYPVGTAQMIPAGSKFVFQQHYTPNGSAADDKTKIGLVFADAADVTHETYTIIGINQQFEIPPEQGNHTVQAKVGWLPERGTLLAFSPHMHLRGKSFQLYAHKSGEAKTLVDVPNYDFNWQHTYQLKEPLPFSEMDRLEMDFVFDNSDANPVNPNPSEFVMWGDQTYEEMAVAFFQVSQPLRDQPEEMEDAEEVTEEKHAGETEGPAERVVENELPEPTPEVKARMEAAATEMLSRFDKNQDGQVARSETPWVFRRYQFRQIDSDSDSLLTREEIEKAARWHVR